jgi:hypothetical protein
MRAEWMGTSHHFTALPSVAGCANRVQYVIVTSSSVSQPVPALPSVGLKPGTLRMRRCFTGSPIRASHSILKKGASRPKKDETAIAEPIFKTLRTIQRHG